MRRTGPLVAGVALALASVLFAACGNSSADALGHQACVDVQASLSLYAKAEAATNPSAKQHLGNEASARLRDALQPAALAGSEDGDWQALEITLSESNRVSEGTLETALNAQCAATLGSS